MPHTAITPFNSTAAVVLKPARDNEREGVRGERGMEKGKERRRGEIDGERGEHTLTPCHVISHHGPWNSCDFDGEMVFGHSFGVGEPWEEATQSHCQHIDHYTTV